MALIKVNYFSRALLRNTDVMVIIPTEAVADLGQSDSCIFQSEYPVLYLYHGAYGDYTDWIRFTDIEAYAQKYRLAIVMPSVDNSFALNIGLGNDYLTFAGEELPQYMEYLFPVSKSYGKKFVAGLSMGGYVAYSIALHYSKKFSRMASLSGALVLNRLIEMQKQGVSGLPFDFKRVLGHDPLEAGEDEDLIKLLSKAKEKGAEPKIYQACGTDDFLYEVNQDIRKIFGSMDVDYVYEEGPGGHEWPFWNRYIERVIKWLFNV